MNKLRIPNVFAAFVMLMLVITSSMASAAVNKNISGKVLDKESKEPLIGCSVLVKGTTTGTATDIDGSFTLDVELPVTLVFSYLGYISFEVEVKDGSEVANISLAPEGINIGQEIVITGSRVSERILEAPISIQKINSVQIANSASGNFYQSLGNLKEVDITTSSLGFQIINTRGFNTTAPVRMVQFVDYMDNQAPGLNFPVGNLVGASDIDLNSVELISGAASALYGANAFQGVVSMITKDPFLSPGLQVKVKGGTRALFDGQVRYANSFGKMVGDKKQFGYKFTFSYMRAEDWQADDPIANTYGDVSTEVNASAIVRQQQFSDDPETAIKFRKLNTYLDFYPVALPGILSITAPGYRETDVSDNTVQSLKASAGLYYNISKNVQLNYMYKMGRGTAIYQGANRYNVKNILFQQHRLELSGKDFFVRAYTTLENAGDSYDMVFTAINLSKIGITNYVSNFLSEYFGKLGDLTNEFKDEAREQNVLDAKAAAKEYAQANSYLKPGTPEFDAEYNKIISDPDFITGSKFQDKSSLQHVEGQYRLDFNRIDFTVGGSFRNYSPKSFGTIFRDTVQSDGSTENLNTWETGGYLQATLDIVKDKLKLIGSARVDKHENFDLQFSPRASLVLSVKNHTLRVSGQSAFRSPTLQNQYILLDLGPITLSGNLDGVAPAYTLESVTNFQDYYKQTLQVDPSLLQIVKYDPLVPEYVKSIEAGYRTVIKNKVFVDVSGYFNWYKNFIGDVRIVYPNTPGVVGEQSGENAILLGDFYRQQRPVNAKQEVRTYGAAASVSYYFWKSLALSTNYSYNNINTDDLTDPIIPGFNTPKHKVNIGLGGQNLWKGFGFSTNVKWVDDFFWQSPFGDGAIPTFTLWDLMVSYELPKYITLQVGGSNITNNRHIEAYGSPMIGGMGYASILFDLNRSGKK